jgi:WD40 repeat protein
MRFTWLLLSLFLLLVAGSRCASQGLKERVVLPLHEQGVHCMAISPDGKTVVIGRKPHDRRTHQASEVLGLWEVETGKKRAELQGQSDGIEALAFSPNGKTLATWGGRNTFQLWDLKTGKESLSFRGTGNRILCLAFSPDSETLGYADDQNVILLEAATGKVLSSFKHSGWSSTAWSDAAVFSSDLKTLATANHQDADLYDTTMGKERLVLEDHRGGVHCLAFSADGKTLAVASTRSDYRKYFGEVKLWDPATGRELVVFKDRINYVRALALSPNGKLLAVAGARELFGANEVKLIDVPTGREFAVVATPKTDWVWSLRFSPDGRLLAGGTGKTLTLWDVQSAAGGAK